MPATARRPTPKQIQLLHVLPARLGWSDEERREFLIARAGKRSSKDLTHREATLLIDRLLEMTRGERIATFRDDGATRFELQEVGRLRDRLGAGRFDGLARRLTRGRTCEPALMTGRETRALIQAAKSILSREGQA